LADFSQARGKAKIMIAGKVTMPALDDLTRMMAVMPGLNLRATNSAFASIGFRLKNMSKEMVKTNELNWPKLSILTPLTKKFPPKRFGEKHKNLFFEAQTFSDTKSKKFWGSLANLPVYIVSDGLLEYGFFAGTFGTKKAGYKTSTNIDGTVTRTAIRRPNKITQNIIDICVNLTTGERLKPYVVNSNVQRYFAAFGFLFKLGTILKLPARPLIGPTVLKARADIPGWFREKFWERLRLYVLGDAEKIRIEAFGK